MNCLDPGVKLYFISIKYTAILLAFISIPLGVKAIRNYYGNQCTSYPKKYRCYEDIIHGYSIANYGLEIDQIDRVASVFMITGFYLLHGLLLKWMNDHKRSYEEEAGDDDIIHAVKVKGLPDDATDNEITEFFQEGLDEGAVTEVNRAMFLSKFDQFKNEIQALALQKHKLEILMKKSTTLIEKYKLSKKKDKVEVKLDIGFHLLKDELLEISSGKKFTGTAYIIFLDKNQKEKVLKEFLRRTWRGWLKCSKRPKERLFRGEFRLLMSPANKPEDIIWENIGIKTIDKISSISFAFFCWVVLLGLSVLGIISLKNIQVAQIFLFLQKFFSRFRQLKELKIQNKSKSMFFHIFQKLKTYQFLIFSLDFDSIFSITSNEVSEKSTTLPKIMMTNSPLTRNG